VYKEAPGFRPGPLDRERRFRVYEEAPGFRPGPRITLDDVAGNEPGRDCSPRHRMPFRIQNALDDVAGNICPAPPGQPPRDAPAPPGLGFRV